MFDWLFDLVYSTPQTLQIILFVVFLIGGLFFLIKGADLFVDSASELAERLKIPAIVVGLTIVALGTSAPEASVSISSAIAGSNEISVGNIIGSNMFNLLVVLGFASIFMPVAIKRNIVKRDVLFMVISSVLLLVFSLLFASNDGFELMRWEGIVLLLLFVFYMVFVVIDAVKKNKQQQMGVVKNSIIASEQTNEISCDDGSLENSNREGMTTTNPPSSDRIENQAKDKPNRLKTKSVFALILLVLIGLVGVVAGGEFVTFGAKNVAIVMGVSEALVGLTIVAIGTSLPEFITSIVAIKKKQTDIALGNIIGSNVFNICLVLALSCIISPLAISLDVICYTIVMTVIFILFYAYSLLKNKISKRVGIVMLIVYILYFAMALILEFV